MTNKELIEHLSTLDPDMKIMVRGYEGGCEDLEIHQIKPSVVLLDYYQGYSYYGEHKHYDLNDWLDPEDRAKYKVIDAILLDRY